MADFCQVKQVFVDIKAILTEYGKNSPKIWIFIYKSIRMQKAKFRKVFLKLDLTSYCIVHIYKKLTI